MKPIIQGELDALRRRIDDLENRLKNERVELGHRVVFDVGRKGEVPAPTAADRDAGKVLGTTGWVAQTGGSGSGGLSTVEVDNLTISGNGSAASPLSASLLSGTINAKFQSLFNVFLQSVTTDSTLSGDGTFSSPLSATPLSGTINSAIVALSGTINSTLQAVFSASQVWSQTTNGTEGNIMTAVIPVPYAGPQYYAFITNSTGSNSPVYRIQNKNSASFQVVSTAPFSNGERIDFLTISGGLGPVWDGSVIANLSGTIDARFFNLSGTIDARFSTQTQSTPSIWDKPAVPHLDDEEFESGTSIPASFSVVEGTLSTSSIDPYESFSTGGSRVDVNSRRPSWMIFQPETSAVFTISKDINPPSDFFVWSRMSFGHRTTTAVNNDQSITLILSEAPFDTQNALYMSLNESDTGIMQVDYQKIVGGAGSLVNTSADLGENNQTALEAIGLQVIGTTVHGWAFSNNGSAMWIGSTTFTPTIGTVAIKVTNASTASPGNMLVGVDFIRFVTGSTFLP